MASSQEHLQRYRALAQVACPARAWLLNPALSGLPCLAPAGIIKIMTEQQPFLHKVQYYETDQMGVVHHSNYVRWFEEARTDLLDRAGLGYAEMEKRGIVVPVLAVSCEYKSSARYGETVVIIPKIEAYTGLRLKVTYRVVDAATGELRAEGETRHAFLDAGFKPARMKKEFPDIHELMEKLTGNQSDPSLGIRAIRRKPQCPEPQLYSSSHP
jgi:acyl-CoA thioester hydrolase